MKNFAAPKSPLGDLGVNSFTAPKSPLGDLGVYFTAVKSPLGDLGVKFYCFIQKKSYFCTLLLKVFFMENQVNSFETVWAALKETGSNIELSRAEFNQKLEQSRAEREQRLKEFDKKLEQSRAERKQSLKEFNQKLKKSREDFDKSLKKSREEHDKIIKNLSQQIGGMANSNGEYAEEFFYNTLKYKRKNLFGEKFESIVKGNKVTINQGYEDEYDILLVNGRAVCVVEVKYKADSGDLPQQVLRKAQTFRMNFPQHKDKKVYLALAGMSINPLTEKACSENGIAIIKQRGDSIVIFDENLKTF